MRSIMSREGPNDSMAYFPDLSEYEYFPESRGAGAKNVGWLQRGYAFDTTKWSGRMLDLLWSFCSVSVMQTRGKHSCDLCQPAALVSAERNGISLDLGSSEIRVFSRQGDIYAAPTLIYHYVNTHQYAPPGEFLRALQEGPKPPAPEYFEELEKFELEWEWTHKHNPAAQSRRLVKHPDGRVELQDLQSTCFHDRDCKSGD
jgi:hypothetical protein